MSIDPIQPSAPDSRISSSAHRAKSGQSFAQLHAAALKDAKETKGATGARNLKASSSATETPSAETYQDVAGHAYDEIVSGKRNGMFINRSGNGRDGEAFVKVVREEREFHVYGTGRERTVVSLRHQAPDASASA